MESATSHVIKAIQLAIAHGPVCEERGIAAAAGAQNSVCSFHIEERFLLTGKAGIRQILCSGTRAHGDGKTILPGFALQRPIGRGDRMGNVVRPIPAQE